DNGHAPNFVFRVSVRDQYAGGYLVGHAKNKGYGKIGLLLERTGWGRSNEKAMRSAIERHGLRQVGIEWFNWGVRDLSKQINNLVVAGAEAVLLVANAREGAVAVRAMAGRSSSSRVPVISHWGITGGNFPEIVGTDLEKVDLQFLQTFSFISPPYPDRAKKVFAAYRKAFAGVDGPEDVFSPVGTAHAYDLIHLLAAAIRKAGTTDRSEVRDALEQLDRYEGLVRDYDPPFTPLRHDALTTADFRMATFAEGGAIVPIGE
ncbi:MAG: ABC transporter substrate-binding protein, partial [Proteobacteria bacterium]|nr:ABC transporter substrate-binding protein [Pseudomonadota bacterium]